MFQEGRGWTKARFLCHKFFWLLGLMITWPFLQVRMVFVGPAPARSSGCHMCLKARGELVVFEESMGNALFVSHQWVAKEHPDPDFEQMPVLQDALQHLLYNSGSVSPDWVTESFVPAAKGISHQEFQSKALFLWYDYFSVPQLRGSPPPAANDSNGSQAKAISSIPAYVARCRFFLALCPTIDSSAQDKVFTQSSWSRRGWCRLERAARELSAYDSWILVQGSTSLKMIGTVLSFGSGPVGEGEFTVEDDRLKLAPVMQKIVNRKLTLSLQAGDLPAYRRHLNLQTLYLTGLKAKPTCNVIPSCDADMRTPTCNVIPSCDDAMCKPAKRDDPVASFLYQNGFRGISEKDSAGFRPLHYAAMSGSLHVVAGLLAQQANPNRRTTKAEPKLGFPPWMSALDMAMFYKHNDAARLLICARAQLDGGTAPAMIIAATSNNVEGIRLLRASGGDPLAKNLFGVSALVSAAGFGSLAAMEELLAQAQHSPHELGKALLDSMAICGGSAELVQRLVGLRADVDFQCDIRRDLSRLGRLLVAAQSLKHRVGKPTTLSAQSYHIHGQTPLMAAMQFAQHEGVAALIAAGARTDIRNCRNWTAADFARGAAVPPFLQMHAASFVSDM